MKVALYIKTIKSARGTEHVTANIAKGLAERGHQVDFLVEEREGWLIEKLDTHPNITVINLNDQDVPVIMHRGFQLWILLINLFSSPLSLVGAGAGTNRCL